MKYFVAQLTEGKHINVPADRMEFSGNSILAYNGENLVAVVSAGEAISAHISEKAITSPAQEQEPTPKPQTNHNPKTKQEQRTEPTEAAYKGFLYIKCEKCGTVKGFCAKTPIKVNRCKCGHETELRDLKPMYLTCKCGAKFKYKTNLTESIESMNCFICGSPVDLEYHDKKGIYETINGCE